MNFIKSFLLNFIRIYQFAILISVLMSWIPNSQNNPIGRFIFQITEPFLGLIRKWMPNMGMIDLSPLVALLILDLLQRLIIGGLA